MPNVLKQACRGPDKSNTDVFRILDSCVPVALQTDFIAALLVTGSGGGDRISDLGNRPEDLEILRK